MRIYAFVAGLAGCAGDPFTLTAYVDLLLGAMLTPARVRESN